MLIKNEKNKKDKNKIENKFKNKIKNKKIKKINFDFIQK